MTITVDSKAQAWFQEEMNVSSGGSIRFFVKYGGASSIQIGFSIGIAKEEPEEPAMQAVYEGITYFIEEKDIWYLDGHSLHVVFDEKLQEPAYEYISG